MNFNESIRQKLFAIARDWVEENGYASKSGVVCIFEGQVQGWVKELPKPADWQPGVCAVSNKYILLAVGGDAVNGAREWRSM
ncbi:MAG: hypothetical protein AB7C96_12255 [Hydrogenovibrio sp.]